MLQLSRGVTQPGPIRLAPVQCKGLLRPINEHLCRQRRARRQEERTVKFQIFNARELVAEELYRGRQRGFDVGGGWIDDGALDTVVRKPGVVALYVQLDVPSRLGMRCRQRLAEERMNRLAHVTCGRPDCLTGAKLGAEFGLAPEALTLPRVRRQGYEVPAVWMEPIPVNVEPQAIQPAQRTQHCRSFWLLAPQRCQHSRLLVTAKCTLLDRRAKHGMRADLEEQVVTSVEQLLDRGAELYRFAHIAPPVRGVHAVFVEQLRSHRRQDRY